MAELTRGGFFAPPHIQYRVRPDPVQNRVKRTERLTIKVIESLTQSPLPVSKRLKTEDKLHPDSPLRFSQPPRQQLLFGNVSQCSFPESNHKLGETAGSQHLHNQAKETSQLE